MSIMAMLASTLGGSAAAGGAATAGASAAGSSFLGNLMETGASALSSVGEAVGLSGGDVSSQLDSLKSQLETLREEAEFIKTSGGEGNMGGYTNEQDRDTDLAENAARTQEVINQIDELEKQNATSSRELEGTLKTGAKTGSVKAPAIASSGGISGGTFDQNALVGAATAGLSGVLGGAPKTTQQQLIQAQHQAFGGFKV